MRCITPEEALAGYLDIREKRRDSVDKENFFIKTASKEKKFRLHKACGYKKKVDRGNVDISGVHCN